MSPEQQAPAGTVDLLRSAHRGQAIVWTAVMLPLFLAIVGLAADGGLVFSARRELQNIADSAARAGAGLNADAAAVAARAPRSWRRSWFMAGSSVG